MKLNLTQFWDEIQSKSIKKWYKNKNAVTGSNQWKFDNKTPKIQWNISLISKPSNQWNLIIKSQHFEWNWTKSWPKIQNKVIIKSPILNQIHVLPLTQNS